jgi:hypothetical protein
MTKLSIVYSLILLTLHPGGQDAAQGLAWLAGCWQGGTGNRVLEEQWMRPRGATMLGSARVTSGDAVREIEFVELRLRGDSVDYIVTPIGQQRTTFTGGMTGPRAFTVSNPANDFPTSVGYDLVSRDSLSAWIEGTQGSTKRRIPYVYHRVPCEER